MISTQALFLIDNETWSDPATRLEAMQRQVRAEAKRGARGDWTYSPARHSAMIAALKREQGA